MRCEVGWGGRPPLEDMQVRWGEGGMTAVLEDATQVVRGRAVDSRGGSVGRGVTSSLPPSLPPSVPHPVSHPVSHPAFRPLFHPATQILASVE